MTHPARHVGEWIVQEAGVSQAELALGISERWRVLHPGAGYLYHVNRVKATYPETGTRLVCSCGASPCSHVKAIYPTEITTGDSA